MTVSQELELHRREADFHDEWALSTPLDQILVHECFEAPTALENRFILGQMGPLRGKKILDIGAGLGESSVYFALQGALVTAADISPRMVDTTVKLGERHGLKIRGFVTVGEDLRLPEGEFDLVYIANTIHHVQDRRRLLEQISRSLKTGGRPPGALFRALTFPEAMNASTAASTFRTVAPMAPPGASFFMALMSAE
jgi:2-polyprenyl-3-methyl-5-hydroxy-6-metoxy-1,4-benzoquinol methylase